MAHAKDQTLLAKMGFADKDRAGGTHTTACQYLCGPDVASRVAMVVTGHTGVAPTAPVVVHHRVFPKSEGEGAPSEIVAVESVKTAMEVTVNKDRTYLLGFIDVMVSFESATYKPVFSKVHESNPMIYDRATLARRIAAVVQSRLEGRMDGYFGVDLPVRIYWDMFGPWPDAGSTMWSERFERFSAALKNFLANKEAFIAAVEEAYKHNEIPSAAKVPEVFKDAKSDPRIWIGNRFDWSRSCEGQTAIVEVKSSRTDVSEIIKQLNLYHEHASTGGKKYKVVATCYPVTPTDKATLKAANIHHIYLGEGFKAYCVRRASEKPVEEAGI